MVSHKQGAAGLASALAFCTDKALIAFQICATNMTTAISRFALVSIISLSFLANTCIAVTQPYIIYPARDIKQTASDDLARTISAISEKFYDYTRWEKSIPEFWVAWLTPTAYTLIRSDPRVNKMPFLVRTLLIGGIRYEQSISAR